MNSQAVNNRVYAAIAAALLAPWMESKGYKLSMDQMVDLVAAAPLVFHALAGIWEKIAAAFVLYFPPPQQGQKVPNGLAK